MAHQCLNSCTNPYNYETNKHYRDQPTPSHPFLICCLCDIAIITDNLLCLIKSNITYSLLLSGDVHPNPGPLEDLLQLLAEQNNTPVFNIPQINLYPHMTFDFESFYIDPSAIKLVKERCYNIIYSCSAHQSLNDCFSVFTTFYVKKSVPLSHIVTVTIQECL